ncbi:uncharacterized protein MAM_02174 [Metarhizium album ARSEF 1941]|uniref:Uncharacterized protein n=1 Tax=Metarhizium album (strain ARSEF 1941) TaxID=1081103 RepID=A0A0B2X4Q5_METAS|nr:uncharacterized protein MAM_02174 [Metarhizium album ARSEF 1941]KHO00251.1 hypothetical protein MAM_02174 [Metarhizium album ARSEF 1941]
MCFRSPLAKRARPAGKSQPDDMPGDKPDNKPDDKPEDKPDDQPDGQPDNKPDNKPDESLPEDKSHPGRPDASKAAQRRKPLVPPGLFRDKDDEGSTVNAGYTFRGRWKPPMGGSGRKSWPTNQPFI